MKVPYTILRSTAVFAAFAAMTVFSSKLNAQATQAVNAIAPASFLGTSNTVDLRFLGNGIERMRMLNNPFSPNYGNIGIGTINPEAKLDVNTSFQFSVVGSYLRFSGGLNRTEAFAKTSHITFSNLELGHIIGISAATKFDAFWIDTEKEGSRLFTAAVCHRVGINTVKPQALFDVSGGQIAQTQAGTFGDFAATDQWIALGVAGSASLPISSTYGMAVVRQSRLATFSLIQNPLTTNPDLIVNFGTNTAAPDPNQRMFIRNTFINSATGIPTDKNLMVFAPGGRVGVNADPRTIAMLVDATPAASDATFRAITVLTNGSFANPVAATFSSIGQEGNSTVAGNSITGLRAQNGDAGFNAQVNGNQAQITWQDLQYSGLVANATNTQDRLTFNFRNNQPTNNSNNLKEVATILANGRMGINTATPVDIGTFNLGPNSGLTAPIFLDVNGGVRATGYWAFSDARLKQNIETIENPLAKVMQLRGTTYSFRQNETMELPQGTQIGFIAQELEKVVPEAVTKDATGTYQVNYDAIIPLLVEGIKAQQGQIDSLRNVISASRPGTDNLLNPAGVNGVGIQGARLDQNAPNPFNVATTISYSVPAGVSTAQINVYDLTGKQLRTFGINGSGEGNMQIAANEFGPGIYIYMLVLDGKEAASRKMIITE
ncbi:MAG: tail fiber domain-containing protein [Bacteroidia bacterium]